MRYLLLLILPFSLMASTNKPLLPHSKNFKGHDCGLPECLKFICPMCAKITSPTEYAPRVPKAPDPKKGCWESPKKPQPEPPLSQLEPKDPPKKGK